MPEPSPAANPAAPRRTLWQRRVLDPVVAQITQGITPEKIALTIAVGSVLANFPIIGTTSILCFLVGVALKLNQPIIQMVNYICYPLHFWMIYTFVRAGEWLFNAPRHPFRLKDMAQAFWESPGKFLHQFGMTGFHAVVVWAIVAPFWVAIVYYISLPILREIVRVRHAAAAKEAADKEAAEKAAATSTPPEPPGEHPVP